MTVVSGDDEVEWVAERRAFAADSRDGSADGRDVSADARELVADTREAELDAWERRLEARAAELGLPALKNEQDADGRAARTLAAEGRNQDGQDRRRVTSERSEESTRRLTDSPPTLLALAFAGIAEQLYDAPTFDEVLQRIAEAAVATVEGCSVASITVRVKDGYRTAAATHPTATAADEAQYLAAEGPSLDAFSAPLVSAPSFPDARWPLLAARPTEAGIESAVSYRLLPSLLESGDPGGSLNTYGNVPGSIDEAAQEIGFILAAHASLAARAVGERSTLEGLGEQLQQALFSRDVIGQAKGILMERLRITPDAAFDVLRRSSQRLNVRLREVARTLTETGEVQTRDLQPPELQVASEE